MSCPLSSVKAGFDVGPVERLALQMAAHSWEYGTAAEALLELHDPDISVFSPKAFPNGGIPNKPTTSTNYAKPFIRTDGETLIEDSSAADPASLGVSAILIGQSQGEYMEAAKRQADYLLLHAPKYPNQAISHRRDEAQLWSDFIYMAPPFLAYYGVAVDDHSIVKEAVRQCALYRETLRDDGSGLWKHIIGGSSPDTGLWSTGNAWAAAGMARVLATISHWRTSANWDSEKKALVRYIGELIDGAMQTDKDQNGFLRNYFHTEDSSKNYGDGSSTALLAATVYRMAALVPETFAKSSYISWADGLRQAIASHIHDGLLAPTVDPLKCNRPQPIDTGSPEGQSFVVLLYAAHRDFVRAREYST